MSPPLGRGGGAKSTTHTPMDGVIWLGETGELQDEDRIDIGRNETTVCEMP